MRRRVLCQEHVHVSANERGGVDVDDDNDVDDADESSEEISIGESEVVADEIDTIESDLCMDT